MARVAGEPGWPCSGPRSTLVDVLAGNHLDLSPPSRTATRHQLETPSKSPPPLPPRSPLRPPPRSPTSTKVDLMPSPMLRMGSSSSFSINSLVDPFPTADLLIDAPFLNDKPKVPPLFPVPRTPSPDKPLPITPSTSTSSPTSTEDHSHDSASNPMDSPPPSATLPPKLLSSGLTKRTHALLELIESERTYASDLALIRDIHLPVALGMCHIYCSSHPLTNTRRLRPRSSHPDTSSVLVLVHTHPLHLLGLSTFYITRPTYDTRRHPNHFR